MVAVPPGSLVLVSGASGFIAAHTVKYFLDAGYPVRGTVRSRDKGEYLSNLFKDSKVPFTYTIVEDIEQPDAFDEAVKDVIGVAHMASPFHFKADDPQELIGPAIGGTVGILKSIQKNNPAVKRVVVTSSVAAIMDERKKPPHTFTEGDWNTWSPQVVEEKGRAAPGGDKYRASKTLAERALWKFIDDEKPTWDAVTINPPMVYGPIIHQVNKPEALNTSVAAFYDWLKGGKTEEDLKSAPPFNWVDVREVALAHVLALTKPEAANNRFICGAGPATADDCCISIHKHFPELSKNVPKGDESKRARLHQLTVVHDGSKLTRMLGVKYRSIDESCKDMAESLIQRFGL